MKAEAVQLAAAWALILALAVVAGAAGKLRPVEARPVLVVFGFESAFDGGILGKKVAEIFRGHTIRRSLYTSIDPVSFAEILAAAGAKVGYDTDAATALALARKLFQAEYAIWGKVTREGKETYILHVRIAGPREGVGALLLDKTYTCKGIHAVPPMIDLPLDAIESKGTAADRDILAIVKWRERTNLVPNPGFEKGVGSPTGWEKVNGLTTFWVDGESPDGKCAMMDTDVNGDQAEAWQKRFLAGAPASAAPKKLPTKPPKYDTVGGTFGAHLYCDWIPIRQGVTYRIDVDVKGPHGNAIVFVKGYSQFEGGDFAEQRREIYRAPLHLHMRDQPGAWEHHAKVFHPTQPLILLGVASPGDGALGAKLSAMLLERAAKMDIILYSPDETRDARATMKMKLGADTSRLEVAALVHRTRGRGVAIWGEVREDEGVQTVHVLGLNIRGDAISNYWHAKWPLPPEKDFPALADKIAAEILRQVRPVRWLRVKLDCYWPAGKYYFDNIALTEVPPDEDIE